MPVCAPESARSVRGELRFVAAPDASGITRVVSASRSAPLQVQRPLYLDPARACLATVNVVNATAGLFQGDAVSLCVDVLPGAAIELRTPTMTRAYAMGSSAHATAHVQLRVATAAYVESLPSAVLLCASAALRQETRVDLAGGAHAAVGEIWAFGRAAHGELHAYRELDAKTEIRCDGVLMLADALVLRPADGLAGTATGGYAAYGSLVLGGPLAGSECLAQVRESLAAHPGVVGGASMLQRGWGIGVRALGTSAHAVDAALRAIVAEFRQRCARPMLGVSATALQPGGEG